MDWKLFLCKVFVIILGGWTVYDSVHNFKKGAYFWFGVRMFVCVYLGTMLVRLSLL